MNADATPPMPALKRLLLINPNTSAEVTARLQAHLQPQLPPDMALVARTAAFGAPYIACESSHAVAAHAVLQAWSDEPAVDAVLIACFGDPGLFALREQAAVPVTGLAEAAFIEAARHGPFAVVTGGLRWKPMLQRLAQALGLADHLLHIETLSPSGAQMLADPVLAREHLGRGIATAQALGARAIIIGGAGLAGWAAKLQDQAQVPLIDSVDAGLRVVLGQQMPAPAPATEPRPDLVRWLPKVGQKPSAPTPAYTGRLPDAGRFPYQAITRRPFWRWPGGAGLAVYLAVNHEHFAFGEGMGAMLGPASPQPDVLNYSWREYGNRVGAWRCLELLDELQLPAAALINTALYDHCPELVAACVARGDELVGHGHTNAERQGIWSEAHERALLVNCRAQMQQHSGQAAQGWLSPWISESPVTPDLLVETGYAYTLNWCHDDQPVPMRTRSGQVLWSIPYPQELNDIPMIMARQMDAKDFAQMIIDQFDEMLEQSRRQPLVMGIALHPYIIGQPYRLRHLRRALRHIVQVGQQPASGTGVWWTTPGAICEQARQHLGGEAA